MISATQLLDLLRGDGPLTPVVSVQYLRYIPQGRRFGARAQTWDLLRSRLKAIRKQSYVIFAWSEVSKAVEVLSQRNRCEGTDTSRLCTTPMQLHYANAVPVPVLPHN